MNVHASTEDKIDDTKDIFDEELERAFNQFLCRILIGYDAM